MSADNGIYVLETSGPEYRVAYSQAIDNIYGKFNDETNRWAGDMDRMMDVFGQSLVFVNVEQALDLAEELSYTYEYLEDGVCLIANFKNMVFGQ